MKGLGRKTRFQKKKHGYSGGGKSIVRKKRDRLFHEGKRDVDHGGEEAPPKTIRPDYKDFMDKDGVVDEWAYGKRLKFLNPHLYPKKKKKKKKK